MSYFDDQFDAWMANDCQGTIEETNPDEVWAEIMAECEERGHGRIKKGICQSCKEVLTPKI